LKGRTMKAATISILVCLLAVSVVILGGCGSEIDDLDRMSLMALRGDASFLKRHLSTYTVHFDEVIRRKCGDHLTRGPLTEWQVAEITQALHEWSQTEEGESLYRFAYTWEDFHRYREKIKQKGGDLSGLETDDIYQIRLDEQGTRILPPMREAESPPELKDRQPG